MVGRCLGKRLVGKCVGRLKIGQWVESEGRFVDSFLGEVVGCSGVGCRVVGRLNGGPVGGCRVCRLLGRLFGRVVGAIVWVVCSIGLSVGQAREDKRYYDI